MLQSKYIMLEKKPKPFYEILAALLKENRITMYRLAKDLGFSQQTVANWCYGISEPKLSQLVRLADYFEVSIDHLAGRKDY